MSKNKFSQSAIKGLLAILLATVLTTVRGLCVGDDPKRIIELYGLPLETKHLGGNIKYADITLYLYDFQGREFRVTVCDNTVYGWSIWDN